MANAGPKIVVVETCRPSGAGLLGGALAAKMPLRTELGAGINDLRRFRETGVRFLPQFQPILKCLVRHLALVALVLGITVHATAAEKVTVTINKQIISAFRTVDLEAAKKAAVATKKPIAWIASAPKLLDGAGTISGNNSRGATLHAFYALRDRCVLVFMDAYEENHKVLPLVDDALHTPDPHYTPPTVVFLDSEAKQVLAKVIYEKDFAKRAGDLAKALQEVKDKL